MKGYHIYLLDVCCYLNPKEISSSILTVCKDWKLVLDNDQSISYYVRLMFNLSRVFDDMMCREIYINHKSNSILNFEAWKTDGGCSSSEINCSYKNMWEYNGTPYSTYYSTDHPFNLNRNVNCIGYYTSGYKSNKNFFDSFQNDIYTLYYYSSNIPDAYSYENFPQPESLTIDPLNIPNFDDFMDFEYDFTERVDEINSSNLIIQYPIVQTQAKALATKIAIARPFNYTGPVKYLFVIGNSKESGFEFSDFSKYDNIVSLDQARFIGQVHSVKVTKDYEIVEYEPQPGFYPVIWVYFKNCGFNHIEYQLKQAHVLKTVNCKLIDIDDRRISWGLDTFQPNFDIMYCVLIGTQLI